MSARLVGLNADLLDGYHASGLARLDQANTFTQAVTFNGDCEIDGALNHDGSTVGFYSATPVSQATAIAKPAGGGTIDAEARTAIDSIIDALGASAGVGIHAG